MIMKKIAENMVYVMFGLFVMWVFLSWLSVITYTDKFYSAYNFFTILERLYQYLYL